MGNKGSQPKTDGTEGTEMKTSQELRIASAVEIIFVESIKFEGSLNQPR